MPGKSVKRWNVYHGLRKRGLSKTRSAKIANSKRRRSRKR